MGDEIEPQSKKQRIIEDIVDLSNQDTDNIPSDVELALHNISILSKGCHGFVFLHQLYATLTNKTIVDDQVALLRAGNKYKLINFGRFSVTQNSSTVIISTEKYLSHLRSELNNCGIVSFVPENLLDKFSRFVRVNNQMSFSVKIMNSSLTTSSSNDCSSQFDVFEVRWLVLKGFLRPQSPEQSMDTLNGDDIYWLWHGGLGQLSMYLDNAEKQILDWISRTKYKEISERELTRQDSAAELAAVAAEIAAAARAERSFIARRPVKTVKYSLASDSTGKVISVLPMAYHLLDLLGKRRIQKSRNNANNDFIVRLAK